MKTTLLSLATALALGALAGCDRAPEQRTGQTPPAASNSTSSSGATSAPTTPQSNTPTTPANIGQQSPAERREGSNPVQQQVDPKQPEQQRDFKTKSGG